MSTESITDWTDGSVDEQQERTIMRMGTVAMALLIASTTGCATGPYAGISTVPGAAGAEIQLLLMSAKAGNKQAQLELGIAFEEGRYVPRDCKRAQKLYRLAAAATGGTIYTYQPPVGKGGRGMVVPINMGPRLPGPEVARQRLRDLDLSSPDCSNAAEASSISKQH